MNENILTWNVENWMTVILMAAIGFFLLGIAQKYWQGRSTRQSTGGNNTQAGQKASASASA